MEGKKLVQGLSLDGHFDGCFSGSSKRLLNRGPGHPYKNCSNVAGIVKQQQEHCEAVAEDLVLPIPAPVASAPSASFVTSAADCHGEYS